MGNAMVMTQYIRLTPDGEQKEDQLRTLGKGHHMAVVSGLSFCLIQLQLEAE